MTEPIQYSDLPTSVYEQQPLTRLVVVHDTDADGLAGAWCVYHYLTEAYDEIVFYPQRAGDDNIPDILEKSDDVMLIDRCYPKDTLYNLTKRVHAVTVLDHHKTAYNTVIEFVSEHDTDYSNSSGRYTVTPSMVHYSRNYNVEDSISGIEFIIDTTQAACLLTYEYVVQWGFTSTKLPWFIEFIADRDIWAWKLPQSKEVNSGMWLERFSFENFDKWLCSTKDEPTVINNFAYIGSVVAKTNQRLIEGIVKSGVVHRLTYIKPEHNITKLNIALLPCPFSLISDTGNYLCTTPIETTYIDPTRDEEILLIRDPVDIAIMYNYKVEEGIYIYSVRSKEDSLFIAKTLNGGGHPLANGFKSTVNPNDLPQHLVSVLGGRIYG